jgi:N-acetylneuraminate synthase
MNQESLMKKNHFQTEFSIDNRFIGLKNSPYIIAELSGNHKGDINRALALIDAAAVTGANAIKIQTYRPDTITLNHDGGDFSLKSGLWQGRTLYDLYEEAHTPWHWHNALFERARSHGITLFSSPFDHTAVDLLESLNCPAYKISSFEIVDIPLIQYVAKTGKPIIMSTGMATLAEIEEAVQAVEDVGGNQLALLHCVSGYPTPIKDCNLTTILDLKSRFDMPIGLSDHTKTDCTAITAAALGANIIEKHFTLLENDDSVDAEFSLAPRQFSALVESVNNAWQALGKVDYSLKSSEVDNRNNRRSLYASGDIKKGEMFTNDNIKSVRPGYGLHPRHLNSILSTTAQCDINFGEPLSTKHIESLDD